MAWHTGSPTARRYNARHDLVPIALWLVEIAAIAFISRGNVSPPQWGSRRRTPAEPGSRLPESVGNCGQ